MTATTTKAAVIGETSMVIMDKARFENGPSPKDSSDILETLCIKATEIGIHTVAANAAMPTSPNFRIVGFCIGLTFAKNA